MIRLKEISKTFHTPDHRVLALDNVNLEIRRGEFLAIEGPSGSGKTTLLLTIAGLLSPDRGTVHIGSDNLYSMNSGQRARYRAAHIGMVFQEFHLIPYLNVLENISIAHLLSEGDHQLMVDHVRRLGLEERINHRPDELSTGEKQRTAIARALINQPSILLADEPTGNLDEQSARQTMDCLLDYNEKGGTLVLATHSETAKHSCDNLVKIQEGSILI